MPAQPQLAQEVAVAELPFEEVVRAQGPALLRLAWRFTRDRDEAQDLVQGALADAWERRGLLREQASAAAWLRRILVNRAVNLHRRKKLWATAQRWLGVTAQEVAPSLVEAQLERASRLRAVHQAVAALPARQAAAFTLRYFEGLRVDEVAQAMGIDVGTARVHLHRALRKLKLLGAHDGETP